MTVSLRPKPRCLEGEFSQRWKGENKMFQELGFDPELVDFTPSYNYPELWPLKGRFQRWQPLSELYEPLSLKFLKRFLCNIFIYYYYYYSVWDGRRCATAVWRSEKALWNWWWISGFQGYRANTFTCWAIAVGHREAIIKWRKRGCLTTLSDLPPLRSLLDCRSTPFLTPDECTSIIMDHLCLMLHIKMYVLVLLWTPLSQKTVSLPGATQKRVKIKKLVRESLFVCLDIHVLKYTFML